MFTEESLRKIFETILIKYNFQFPISWVWIGINGAFLTGRFEFSKNEKFKSIILNGKAKKLRFPINAMLVDARGEAAHVLLKRFGEVDMVTRCKIDDPPPMGPLN
jgi:hypothetical protein